MNKIYYQANLLAISTLDPEQTQRHILGFKVNKLQLSKVHKFLARGIEAFSSEDIKNRTGVHIENSPDILLSLNENASKVISEMDGKWRWASKNQLTSSFCLLREVWTVFAKRTCRIRTRGVRDDTKKHKAINTVT